jgi:hypothetical protein
MRGKHNLHARNAHKWGVDPTNVKDRRSGSVLSAQRGDRVL